MFLNVIETTFKVGVTTQNSKLVYSLHIGTSKMFVRCYGQILLNFSKICENLLFYSIFSYSIPKLLDFSFERIFGTDLRNSPRWSCRGSGVS
jgi:hypothetical protein